MTPDPAQVIADVTELWYALRKGDPTLTALYSAEEAERYRAESTAPWAIQHIVITTEYSDPRWPGWELTPTVTQPQPRETVSPPACPNGTHIRRVPEPTCSCGQVRYEPPDTTTPDPTSPANNVTPRK